MRPWLRGEGLSLPLCERAGWVYRRRGQGSTVVIPVRRLPADDPDLALNCCSSEQLPGMWLDLVAA